MTDECPADAEPTDTEARVTALIVWSERMYAVMVAAGVCTWVGLAAGYLGGLAEGYVLYFAAAAVVVAAMVAGVWLMMSADRLAKADARTTPEE